MVLDFFLNVKCFLAECLEMVSAARETTIRLSAYARMARMGDLCRHWAIDTTVVELDRPRQ
jgi:hypothetical protein